MSDVFAGDIGKICVTNLRSFVPLIHGIDSFGEFSTAALIYTARVDPLQFESAAIPYISHKESLRKSNMSDIWKGVR
jgi:hypothetical protein